MSRPHLRISQSRFLASLKKSRISTAALGLVLSANWAVAASTVYTPLVAIPAPKVVGSSSVYPGNSYVPAHLVDGKVQTEFSSKSDGTNTWVDFDLGADRSVMAFRHVDRNDPATVGASELVLQDAEGRAVGRVGVKHSGARGGSTFHVFEHPIAAHKVRWRVTAVGPNRHSTVGGAEIQFYSAGEPQVAPRNVRIDSTSFPMIERKGDTLAQPVRVVVEYLYAEPVEAILLVDGAEPRPVQLSPGIHPFDYQLPVVKSVGTLQAQLTMEGAVLKTGTIRRAPVRPLQIYLLPHSHVDIGYTALQPDVEKKQNVNIETGLKLAASTRNYPEGSRFKWNVEVLWPVENYLRQASPEKKAAFVAAVRSGEVGLDAFYGNILTGLCRPEELLRLMSYATRLSQEWGVPVESAMISDVPGYTWSTVSAMAHAGVRYFSFAPNYFDRIGATMEAWQNKPFYWKSPDGEQRVLCWCPSRGYALGHIIGDGEALARYLPTYLVELQTNNYPYDISCLRWNVHGDNGSPDEKHADVVRAWNERYASPRLIISTTAAAFREFEARHGKSLPEYSGDYTPYWEDGAGSSARETALNRASAERLVQAETIWAMRSPGPFPAEQFQAAWRNVLLYSEHTWGAHNSINEPDLPFVLGQWKIKQAFALDADAQSTRLLEQALAPAAQPSAETALDVYNTCSWPRTDRVIVPADLSKGGDVVFDASDNKIPSQRLASGELVFIAEQVPPFASTRYRLKAGTASASGGVTAGRIFLAHPDLMLRVNEQTGGLDSLFSRTLKTEFADLNAEAGMNDYFYLPGSDLRQLRRNPTPTISVKDKGPLVGSLLIESAAPGCNRLSREIRVVDGLDYIEIINTVDKQAIRSKEGLHFGFGFKVADSTVRMDVGWAVVRPEVDQLPASCKNWFSVQRWVDISNRRQGVTWVPADAPLVEVGGITANMVGSQPNPRSWMQNIKSSPTIYSWVMNNHWHTNYRAEQDGRVTFRYFLRLHRGYNRLEASRFGTERTQPLIVTRAASSPAIPPGLEVRPADVLVTAYKPSDDGKARIIRLYGASGKDVQASIVWGKQTPVGVWLSDTSERPLRKIDGGVSVPGSGIVTLRAEFGPTE